MGGNGRSRASEAGAAARQAPAADGATALGWEARAALLVGQTILSQMARTDMEPQGSCIRVFDASGAAAATVVRLAIGPSVFRRSFGAVVRPAYANDRFCATGSSVKNLRRS